MCKNHISIETFANIMICNDHGTWKCIYKNMHYHAASYKHHLCQKKLNWKNENYLSLQDIFKCNPFYLPPSLSTSAIDNVIWIKFQCNRALGATSQPTSTSILSIY